MYETDPFMVAERHSRERRKVYKVELKTQVTVTVTLDNKDNQAEYAFSFPIVQTDRPLLLHG